MKRIAATLIMLSAIAGDAHAQTAPATRRSAALADATRLANNGQLAAARTLVDSLVRSTPADAPDLDEMLFVRATLASSVLDATFDYEKIIADPSSERRKESLLRVAQRALIAGESAKALDYLRTMSRDYPDDTSLATSLYWKASALIDTRDILAACEANREARSHAQISSTSMLAAIDAQAFASCPRTPSVSTVPVDTVAGRPIPVAAKPKSSNGVQAKLYAVQVSAFPKRSDAEEMAARLTARGFDAHADGTERPFRVRIGHYATYAAAATEQKKLKAQKLTGFVTALEQ